MSTSLETTHLNSHDRIAILGPRNMSTIRQKRRTTRLNTRHISQWKSHPSQIIAMALHIWRSGAAPPWDIVQSSIGFAVETGGHVNYGGCVIVNTFSFEFGFGFVCFVIVCVVVFGVGGV